MVKSVIAAAFALGLVAGVAAVAPEAAYGQRGGGQNDNDTACVVWEHENYGGDGWSLGARVQIGAAGPRWNDRISSVRCRPGCVLTAWEHEQFRGASQSYRGETRAVGRAWNDRISSFRTSCDRPGERDWDDDKPDLPDRPGGNASCTYYEHASFAGRRETLRDGGEVRQLGSAWNDRISSVSCAPGCELVAWEHEIFRGAQQRYRGRVEFVGLLWNDRVSSVRAVCRR